MAKILECPPERVMIACLVNEISMIVETAKKFKIDRLHILNYIRPADVDNKAHQARERYYKIFRDELEKDLQSSGIKYELHTDKRTYVFDEVMGDLYQIIQREIAKESMIFVNISGGTNEYAAAAYVSSMMNPGITLFSTGMESNFDEQYYEAMIKTKTINNKLVGSSNTVYNTYELTGFNIEKPDLNLMMALKVFNSLKKGSRTGVTVIRSLINHGIWFKSIAEEDPLTGTSLEPGIKRDEISARIKNEKNYYQRHYIDSWVQQKWIVHDEKDDRFYDVTEDGENYLKIFCPDEVFTVNVNKLAQPPARGGRRF